ncbi:hypothetical protein AN218_05705 [Streptomyces nanshensis]|uniref:Uncharacterized protein n=2 Tax=Streptomyces nanshensis TaxID=518642 RepID=A0A1E7LA21_9ACTN|nr:hypothetical protein AN218_05705 [Streptomyces nanshensis]
MILPPLRIRVMSTVTGYPVEMLMDKPAHVTRMSRSPTGPLWAYLDAAGLLLLIVPNMVTSLALFAQLCGIRIGAGIRTLPLTLEWISAGCAFLWLGILVIGRRPRGRTRAAAAAVGATAVYASTPAAGQIQHPYLQYVALIATLTWLVLEVCRRHGICPRCLGLAPPDARDQRQQALMVGWMSVQAYVPAVLAVVTLPVLLSWWDGAPLLRAPQIDVLGISPDRPLGGVLNLLLCAGVVEDLIVVAGVTAVLTSAAASARVVYATVGLAAAVLHLYLGLPGLVFGISDALRAGLLRRYGRLTPMIMSHLICDIFAFALSGMSFLATLAVGAVLVVAFKTIERLHVSESEELRQNSPDLEISIDAVPLSGGKIRQ